MPPSFMGSVSLFLFSLEWIFASVFVFNIELISVVTRLVGRDRFLISSLSDLRPFGGDYMIGS